MKDTGAMQMKLGVSMKIMFYKLFHKMIGVVDFVEHAQKFLVGETHAHKVDECDAIISAHRRQHGLELLLIAFC